MYIFDINLEKSAICDDDLQTKVQQLIWEIPY